MDRLLKIHPNEAVASVLHSQGFTSALDVAKHAPGHFVTKVAPHLGGDTALARRIYDRATQVRSSVMHAWANVQTAVHSPHFNALRVANVSDDTKAAFDQLPSYQELFGTLNYCSCDECRSIFGAAAYLVDLLRVIDVYVTIPNTIPDAFKLDTRRGDLGKIPLTCAMTNDTFPLLRVVNKRLGALARTYLGIGPTDDVFEPLSRTTYPFNLPFNLPVEQITLDLAQVGVALADVYRKFGAAPADVGRASFGMSREQFAFLTTPLSDPAPLAASYGVDPTALPGLSDVSRFLAATGLELVDLMSLFAQGLSAAEIGKGVAAGFFINAGLGGTWLTYQPGDEKTPATIGGFPADPKEVDPLDRISRFIRLAVQLGWDYAQLDWALRAVATSLRAAGNAAPTLADIITALADGLDIARRSKLDVPTLCALLGPIKPYGAGDGTVSTAPFDVMFNDPRVLKGRAPYHPSTPLNLLYTDTPTPWNVAGTAPADLATSAFVAAGIGVSLGTLTVLGTNLFGAAPANGLTLDVLSALYRHAVLLRTFRMTAGQYGTFMTRCGYVTNNLLNPTLSLADLRRAITYADWLRGSGLTIDQLDYVLGGQAGAAVDPLFVPASIKPWLAVVRNATAGLAGTALDGAILAQLATLFNVSADLVEVLHPVVLGSTPPPQGVTWEDAFTAAPPTPRDDPPQLGYVTSYVTAMSRWLVLTQALGVPTALLRSVSAHPAAYGMPAPLTGISLDGVYWLSTFQQLASSFGDNAGRLTAFVDPSVLSPPPDPAQQLAATTGWDPAQTAALLVPFASQTNRVSVVAALNGQVVILNTLGADPSFVTNLVSVTTTPNSTWADYTGLAELTLAKTRASVSAAQWPALSAQLDGAVAERVRSVLAPYVLAHLRAAHPAIATLRNLSEYLLLDVEVSGALQISYVREALNAAQLYLQRCRLRLEPIQTLEIPEIWWEWLMNYRIWEANREIFLYPENYIDPTLRKSATPLFQDLENQLLQGEVTAETVDTIYRTYVDGLLKLADLEYVDAYHCTVNDPQRGPIDTMFFFARTTTDPYSYYSISFEVDTGIWSAWQPIAVTIPAAEITPAYAFNHLFVFWVELKTTKSAAIQQQQSGSTQGITYQATIKYSFTDFNGHWIQPQALVEDKVVYYMPSADDQQGALGPLNTRPDLFQMSDLFWNKVSVVVVDPTLGSETPDPAQQKLVVLYGPFMESVAGTSLTPMAVPAPLANADSSALIFNQTMFEIVNSYNQLLGANVLGYLPMVDGIVLDHHLNVSYLRRANELIVLEKDFRERAPAVFKPELETVAGTLVLATAYSAHLANFLADFTPQAGTGRPPQLVTAASFVTSTIDAPTSTNIFNALVGNNTVVPVANTATFVVSPSFGANPDLSLFPDTLQPQIRAILFNLLGDPTIFGYQIPGGAPVVDALPASTSRVVAVKNQPGTFLVSTGPETFLLTPRGVNYAQLSAATAVSAVRSSPIVFDEFLKPVDPLNYKGIFAELIFQNVVIASAGATSGRLDPLFWAGYDLSFLFAGSDPVTKARLTTQVRRILLNLPSLTVLIYAGNQIPRFVTGTSFVSLDITAAQSQGVFNDLVFNGIIDAQGNLQGEVSQTTPLSFLFEGAPDPPKSALIAEVRSVLMSLPKLVQPTSFVSADIDATASQAALTALVAHNVVDANGAVPISFGPKTDLSFLFPDVAEPQRDQLIAEVRAVVQRFFDSAYRSDVNELSFDVQRVTARTSARELSFVLFAGGVHAALALDTQNAPVVPKAPFDRLAPRPFMLTPPALFDGAQIDFDGPYGLYYWELFFHAPMLVAGALARNQQYADAKTWLEFVLDPTVAEAFVQTLSFVTPDIDGPHSQTAYQQLIDKEILLDLGSSGARVAPAPAFTAQTDLSFVFTDVVDPTRLALMLREVRNVLLNFQLAAPPSHYWQFRPFRNHTLESLKALLTNPKEITTYNQDPFDPHAIARLRIGAYEKTMVMKYVDTLLAWGDMLFTQFTWESITNATLLYMYAQDLLGDKPEDLGACPLPPKTLTFNDIKAKYEADGTQWPQFFIDLEDFLPALPHSLPAFTVNGDPFNALDSYFCVPENAQLAAYWDRVADRLTKIRNGMNINGVKESIALFDPPIDPMALVRLAASGAGILGIADAGTAAISSSYRFAPLHAQAVELASTVTALGGGLLAALEKNDAALLDVLRTTQETAILNLTTAIKQKQIDDLTKTMEGLVLSRDRAQFQADHYTALHTSGWSSQETVTHNLQISAITFQALAAPFNGLAIDGHLTPAIFGLADGGMKWGDAISMGAEIATGTSATLNLAAGMTATTAEFNRRDDDWDFQSQLALRDVDLAKKQIEGAAIQIASAQQDLAVHNRSIAQSNAVATFLTSRFSSADLYQWMIDRIAAIYFQAYTMAVDVARKAELAFQYELNSTETFVGFTYWDSLRKGLLAGETLNFSLLQMKKAYVDGNSRSLEIEKTISLQQLDPMQIINLREGKACTFNLTETMFDFDFPGHYRRQIASVSISIPALVGPYQNINAVLTQESSSVVMQPKKEIVDYLVTLDKGGTPGTQPDQSQLRQNWLPQQQIAISRGVNDGGMFELNFNGDRYLPFEGTGAVSKWTLSVPPENNRINLANLTDVVIDLKYTAVDGGFRADVIEVLKNHNVRYTGRLYLDMRSMFASAWFAFMNPAPGATTQVLTFPIGPAMFPYFRSIRLDQVSIKLDVSTTVTIPDPNAFVQLKIGSHTFPQTGNLSFAGPAPDWIALVPTDLSDADFLAPWSLTVTLANAPELLANGILDPQRLLNFEFILTYSADVYGTS